MSGQDYRLLMCFIGIDGCGKTTHAISLCKKLRDSGLNYKYIHHTHTLKDLFPAGLRVSMRKHNSMMSELNAPSNKHSTKGKSAKLKNAIISFITLIDSIIGFIAEATPSSRNTLIVYDRYIYDRVISYLEECPKWLTDFYWRLIPNPDLIFLLDLPASFAYQRKRDVPVRLGEMQRKSYLSLAKSANLKNLVIVSATSDAENINRLILNHVIGFLKVRKIRLNS